MNIRSFILVSVILVLITAAQGVAQTVKVAAIFTKTNELAYGNKEALNGVRFAVEDINRQGGVSGRPLELLEFDNKGTALGSKIAAQKAVGQGVVAVFGANWSSHSLAMAPVLQAAGIPMISPISTHPDVTRVGNYIFRVCYSDPFQAVVLSRFAFEDLKARTVGILVNVDDTYSEGLARFFIESFQKRGGNILFVENYLENRADFTPFIEKANHYQPDILFHPGHTKMSAYVLRQARNSGINTTFLGGDGWNSTMYKIAGSAINGSYYSSHWHPDSETEKSRQFVERNKGRVKEIIPVMALANDCVFLFADAVKRANSFEPARIRDAIAATKNFEGVTGTIRFDENGDPIKPAVILKFENERSIYVKTVEP